MSSVVGYVSLWKTGLNVDITPKLGEPVFAKNKFERPFQLDVRIFIPCNSDMTASPVYTFLTTPFF